MPKFGKTSKAKLETCDERLQEILNEAIKHYDFSVLCGYRGEEEQNKLFDEGKTKVKFPDSKHNRLPSLAVDIAPYPVQWNDTLRFARLFGLIEGIALERGYKLRWGADWDMDNNIKEHNFLDFPHIGLLE